MSAGHYKTDNLVGIIDANGQQIDGNVKDIMDVAPLADKWAAFGWHTQVIDGHDYEAIDAALDTAINVTGKPAIIICKTVKGKGVSFMEGVVKFHGTAPSVEQSEIALQEIEEKY